MASNAEHRLRKRLLRIAHLTGLFLAMSLICLPGLRIVLNSFRPTVEIMAKPPVWVPNTLNLDHYRAMFGGVGEGGVPVLTYFRNSLIISVTSTLVALLVGRAGAMPLRAIAFGARPRWSPTTSIWWSVAHDRPLPAAA